ncbi:transcriptional regulator, DeoR family [Alkalispirochaeta americana]|uniref:Transcriptional regulator, DeoR family n=1 Tax=Alkalispirochaeta americana TaxID=159291 RepID=A0A1N6ULN3_9SPIO|nr:DeoR/GlpR family DNA-binding transcription regulator [Alkalispirochaeta americana]SIQ66513.1 transcriptional regulator, DeoR family [Alkalispirochaeta americana]
MFALERLRIIKEYLINHRQAEVGTLSNLLSVSEVTIRRDLVKLEDEGFLTRTHGGAMLADSQVIQEPSLITSDSAHISRDTYPELAIMSLRLILDNAVVFLADGPINFKIAEGLKARSGVTVLTNDLVIASLVARQKSNRAVLLGGDLNEQGDAVYGAVAQENLLRYHVDILFFEVDAVNHQLQLTVTSEQRANLIMAAAKSADKSVLVCPANRFGRGAFFRFASIHLAEAIVTDPSLPDTEKNRLFSENITVFTAINAFEGSL